MGQATGPVEACSGTVRRLAVPYMYRTVVWPIFQLDFIYFLYNFILGRGRTPLQIPIHLNKILLLN